MRILAISQYYPPDPGGGSRRASNVMRGLKKRGNEVLVISAFPHYPLGNIPYRYQGKAFVREKDDGTDVIRVWVPGIAHKGFLRRLVMYLTFAFSALFPLPLIGKIDAIWAANSNVFSSIPGIIISMLSRKPLVRNVDDLWPETAVEEGVMKKGLGLKIGELLAKISYKLCRMITPISHGYVDHITRKYDIPRKKFGVVWHGVETEIFSPVKVNRKKIHPKFEDKFIALYSGVLSAGYDFDLVFQAAEILADEDILFVIRGFGPRLAEFEKKVVREKLHNVLILSKHFELSELVEFLCAADVFLLPMMPLPAHDAGIPTKLFEYMACEKPIVVSSTGAPASLVEKARAGIVTSRNAQEFARAIRSLVGKPELRKQLGLNGRMFIEQHLTIETIGERMEKIFESL